MKIFKNIQCCRICGSKRFKVVLNLNDQPTANQLTRTFHTKEAKVPLKLVFCLNCKTTQLSSTVKSKYLFSKYLWVTGTSNVAKDYCKYFVNITKNKIKKTDYIFEIASNDGTLLKEYKKNGYKILGVDPAKNISKQANKDNITTIDKFFNFNLSNKIKKKYGKPGLIIARNVIPHVEHIHSILKGIKNLIQFNGIVAIEFHSLYEIIKGLQYDSIYHEHLFYFSTQSIMNLFKKYNLHAYDITKSPISGGSNVLFFSSMNKIKTRRLQNQIELERKSKINNLSTLEKFGRNCVKHRNIFNKIVKSYNGKIYAYGASARSSTLLNFSNLNYKNIRFVTDKNSLKSGLFTPGTKIKILKYKKKLIPNNSNIIILAWNFKNEIISQFKNNNLNNKYIVPLPRKIKIYENKKN